MRIPKFSILIAALAFAGCTKLMPQPPSREQREKEFLRCFRAELKPTEEQLTVLEGKVFQNTSGVQKVAEQLRRITAELEKGLESETGDALLLERYGEVARLKAQLSEDHFRRMLLLRSILTPEQRSRFLVCKRKMAPSELPHE